LRGREGPILARRFGGGGKRRSKRLGQPRGGEEEKVDAYGGPSTGLSQVMSGTKYRPISGLGAAKAKGKNHYVVERKKSWRQIKKENDPADRRGLLS